MRLVTSPVAVADRDIAEQWPRGRFRWEQPDERYGAVLNISTLKIMVGRGPMSSHTECPGRGLRRMRSAGSGQVGTWPHVFPITSNKLSNFARNFNFSYRLEQGFNNGGPLDSRRAPAFAMIRRGFVICTPRLCHRTFEPNWVSHAG
jgi:hypothetical protein